MMDLFRETENLALGQTSLYPVTIYHHGILLGFMKPTARDFMGSGSVLQQVLSRAEELVTFVWLVTRILQGLVQTAF